MAFVTLSVLVVGSLFIAVPIALHLLMRQRPKHLRFPAIRFLQERRVANRRQMRLRNWLLLLLRCLAVVLLAATLARPSVASAVAGHWLKTFALAVLLSILSLAFIAAIVERKGRLLTGSLGVAAVVLAIGMIYWGYQALTEDTAQTIGDAGAPVAAVLLFDTSPRMGYVHQNQTRLEQARETARWLLQQFPAGSEVAIVDSAAPQAVFAVDIGAAVNMMDALEITNLPTPLHELLVSAVDVVRERDDKRTEVYVFSDLTQAAWQSPSNNPLSGLLKKSPDVLLYVLDVGVENPANFGFGQLELSAESLPSGRALTLSSELSHIGPGGSCDVEVHLEQQDNTRPVTVDGKTLLPESLQRDRTQVTLQPDGLQRVEFELRGLEKGTHHGFLNLTSGDALAIDDRRYFTVEIREPLSVLLAAGEGAVSRYLANSLSPYILRETGQASFECDVIGLDELSQHNLDDFAAIGLLDPAPIAAEQWQRLEQYVRGGGGLAVFLGRNAAPLEDFNAAAASVLPGTLHLQWHAARGEQFYIAPRNLSHPILAAFRSMDTIVPWDSHPVFIHWALKDTKPGAAVVTSFSNNQPAIWESTIGEGRVLTMTTPVSDPRNDPDRPAWNWLPTGEDWSFFVLANEMIFHLTGGGERSLNYRVGQTAEVRIGRTMAEDQRYQLFTPRGDWQDVTSKDASLTVRFTETPGTYRLKPVTPRQPVLGFSANLPAEATRLERIEKSSLDEILGQGRYVLARSRDEIGRGIGRARIGREFYPFLLALLAAILGCEHLMSNRFYTS